MNILLRSALALMLPLGLSGGVLLSLATLPVAALAAAADKAADKAADRAVEAEAPARVGRIARAEGEVSWFDIDQGLWQPAEINRPLTGGDRVSTGGEGRAELRVGSTVLRLAAGSEVEVLRLDDAKIVLQLHSGALALRVRTRALAQEIELVTDEARLAPQRAGHYRVDRSDDRTSAGAWRGELRVLSTTNAGFDIAEGEHHELWRDASGRLRSALSRLPDDALAAWTLQAEANDQRSASARHVSPEMTGAEELDRHGRWDRHPEHGAIWVPLVVASGWAPYRDGRWVWVRPWGWTWVDTAPWGFAPFHYGRWVHWTGRWAWVPGAYAARPVYSPGLVAWVGGPGLSIGVQIGRPLPQVGWVALAPYEPYRPHYFYRDWPHDRWPDRRYVRPGHGQQKTPPVAQAPGRAYIPDRVPRDGRAGGDVGDDGPRHWRNQDAPGGLTVVTRDAMSRRVPVRDAALPVSLRDLPGPRASAGAEPGPALVRVQPPPHRVDGDTVGPLRPTATLPAWRTTRTAPASPQVESQDLGPTAPPAADRNDRDARSDGTQRFDRIDRVERVDRVDRVDRSDRSDRSENRPDPRAERGLETVRPALRAPVPSATLPPAMSAPVRPTATLPGPMRPAVMPEPAPGRSAPAPAPAPAVAAPLPQRVAPLPERPQAQRPTPPAQSADDAQRPGLRERERERAQER